MKPKLLIVVDTYYPKIDGTLRFVEELIAKIKPEFSYHLIVPDYEHHKDTKQITFLKVSKIIKSSGYHTAKLSFKNLGKIKNAVKEADIVFAQGPATISFFSILYSRWYKKPCVGYLHIDVWEFFKNFIDNALLKVIYQIFKPLLTWIMNKCTLILIPYHDLETKLLNHGVKTPVKVARLGVDIEKLSPAKNKAEYKEKIGIPKNKTVIGYVGRISNEKNTKVLLDAFRKLPKQRELFLLMVGDGDQKLISIFRENKNCQVTGFVRKIEDYYKAMDIFVMPSLTETTSLATLEAMSSGLPVIATKVGFIRNYLVKDYNGLFFPRGSSTMLAIKIEKLLKDHSLRDKFGRNARKTVTYSFSWERSVNRIKRLLIEELYNYRTV